MPESTTLSRSKRLVQLAQKQMYDSESVLSAEVSRLSENNAKSDNLLSSRGREPLPEQEMQPSLEESSSETRTLIAENVSLPSIEVVESSLVTLDNDRLERAVASLSCVEDPNLFKEALVVELPVIFDYVPEHEDGRSNNSSRGDKNAAVQELNCTRDTEAINCDEVDLESEVVDSEALITQNDDNTQTQDIVVLNEVQNIISENIMDINTEGRSETWSTKIPSKRRITAQPSEWSDHRNKRLREEGKKYIGWTKPKGKRGERGQEREERKMGRPCTSKHCQKVSARNCQNLTEEVRKELFTRFWNEMSWDQRKIFVSSLVTRTFTKRTTVATESRRKGTFSYLLKTNDGTVFRVCKMLFLSTFGLREWSVHHWVEEATKKNGICTAQKVKNDEKKKEAAVRTRMKKRHS
ncbi:uncharacterized protein [Rhodnius prolixus]|uniref:uncharacterized protein n=1 Tax=Rhodnius prolixus TaxID=13249 RepID=UPI003D189E4A